LTLSKHTRNKFRKIDARVLRLPISNFPTSKEVPFVGSEIDKQEIENWFAGASKKQSRELSRILKTRV
jgi:hypothetical protein